LKRNFSYLFQNLARACFSFFSSSYCIAQLERKKRSKFELLLSPCFFDRYWRERKEVNLNFSSLLHSSIVTYRVVGKTIGCSSPSTIAFPLSLVCINTTTFFFKKRRRKRKWIKDEEGRLFQFIPLAVLDRALQQH
jgi:hypothetical protein